MNLNPLGLILAKTLAERENVSSQRATQLGLIGGMMGKSLVPAILVQQIARREAASAASPAIPTPAKVEVPVRVGMSLEQAFNALHESGLRVGSITSEGHLKAIEQIIVKSYKPTDPVPLGMAIDLLMAEKS